MDQPVKKIDLKEVLKEKGLESLEDLAANAVNETHELLVAIQEKIKNPFLGVAISIFGVIKGQLLTIIDKIDGKEG